MFWSLASNITLEIQIASVPTTSITISPISLEILATSPAVLLLKLSPSVSRSTRILIIKLRHNRQAIISFINWLRIRIKRGLEILHSAIGNPLNDMHNVSRYNAISTSNGSVFSNHLAKLLVKAIPSLEVGIRPPKTDPAIVKLGSDDITARVTLAIPNDVNELSIHFFIFSTISLTEIQRNCNKFFWISPTLSLRWQLCSLISKRNRTFSPNRRVLTKAYLRVYQYLLQKSQRVGWSRLNPAKERFSTAFANTVPVLTKLVPTQNNAWRDSNPRLSLQPGS